LDAAKHRLLSIELPFQVGRERAHILSSGALALDKTAGRLYLFGVSSHQRFNVTCSTPCYQSSSLFQALAGEPHMESGGSAPTEGESETNPLTGQLDWVE
jgi:hypothetical protein